MVFSSLIFLYLFLPLSLLSYFITPKKAKNITLLVSGFLFYSWGEPFYVIIMFVSIIIDYTAGRLMDRYDNNQKLRFVFLLSSIIMNLGLLGFFKYSNFFIVNVNRILSFDIPLLDITLPIGISFYTFQSMSYTIDLYKRRFPVQKNIIKFGSYITLFPQIVAGPIVRYSDIRESIDDLSTNFSNISDGILIFLIGLSKKVMLANSIGLLWSEIKVLPVNDLSVLTAWLGILAFTFQIYFDFSGYSDMAVGLGKCLGFNFPGNFDYPYMSKSISEFWRRWHITLGSWFRSYVYVPLGGNRKGKLITVLNLIIVWFLTGFWHGAGWNFIIWGLYFGFIIIIEKLFLENILKKIPGFFSWIYTFVLVVIGWVIFELDNLNSIFSYVKSMFGINGNNILDNNSLYYLFSYLILFIICAFSSTNLFHSIHRKFEMRYFNLSQALNPIFIFVTMIICTALLVNSTYNPFLYFKF